jgi:hypothetical protein
VARASPEPCAVACPCAQAFQLQRAEYKPDAINAFYRFIWTLFYSEYAMLPFL